MTLHAPTTTVVIAAFDAATTIGETLRSVLPRLGPDDEVLVCDDGSRDATVDVAGSTGDHRVRVLEGSHSGTPSTPRNRGIEAARGDLVFFVDADDLALADKFRRSREALAAHADAAMVFTDFQRIDAEGTVLEESVLAGYELKRRLGRGPVHRLDPETATRLLARENFVGTSGVAVRADVLRALGGFDPGLPNSEDRDLWFRIAREHPIVFLDEVLHAYRSAPVGITGRAHADTAPARLEVFHRQLDRALDDAHARDLRASMAACLDAVAYEAFREGSMRKSRHAALRAWRLQPRAARLRRAALTCLGSGLVDRLRRVRR